MSTTKIPVESEMTSSGIATTKLCYLIKRADFEGYGFNLHSEKSKPGQYIGKVDPNSPAEHAGLLEGERIVEVNGVNIGNETHKQVVQRIKALSSEVRVLLITADAAVKAAAAASIPNQLNADASAKELITTTTTTTVTSNNNNNSNSNINSSEMTTNAIATKTTNGTANKQTTQRVTSTTTTITTTPPPPSKNIMSVKQQQQDKTNAKTSATNNNNPLQLPMTAAEMRAKLLAKKKYDPKNEAVDLKKKYEIIQKL